MSSRIAGLLRNAAFGDVEPLRTASPAEWSGLAAVAADQQLDGLLYRACRAGDVPIPAPVARQLAGAYRQTAGRNFAAVRRLEEVLGTLRARGVRVVVLPGASLLSLYPDPGCRPMDDVDLLVRPGDAALAAAALRAAGLISPERHHGLFACHELTIDLHVDLLNADRIGARRLTGWIDPSEVRRDSELRCVEGVMIPVPADEDALLYTAVHALRHGFGRLTWFLDICHLLARPIDRDTVCAKARRYRVERAMAYALHALRDRFGQQLPAPFGGWLADLHLGDLERRLLRRALADGAAGQWGDLLWAFSVAGPGPRLRFVLETAFPRPSVLLQVFPRLPRRLVALAYPLRAGQLAWRGAAQLGRLVRRHAP